MLRYLAIFVLAASAWGLDVFPASPTNGQQATISGWIYTYAAADTTWYKTGGAYISSSGGTVTGTLTVTALVGTERVVLPSLTTAQRVALTGPVSGTLVWDSTVTRVMVYNGSAWVEQ
jgi:hypothetical protein